MKLYLSLPITGRSLVKVKEHARKVKSIWVEKGHEVITPFEVCPIEGMPYNYYMGRDIEALLGCDGIVMCHGWFGSQGCRAEYHVAETYRKKVFVDETVYEEDKVQG